jgi:hypothetical protein
MSEEVNTGGLMRFKYGASGESKLSDAERDEIRDAYARAGERKRREKLTKWIVWMIIALIIVVGVGYFLLR